MVSNHKIEMDADGIKVSKKVVMTEERKKQFGIKEPKKDAPN